MTNTIVVVTRLFTQARRDIAAATLAADKRPALSRALAATKQLAALAPESVAASNALESIRRDLIAARFLSL